MKQLQAKITYIVIAGAMIANANAMTVDAQGRAILHRETVRLATPVKPAPTNQVVGWSAIIGATVGALGGAYIGHSNYHDGGAGFWVGASVGGLLSAAVAALVSSIQHSNHENYKNMYETTNGLNAHGAAAENNSRGLIALKMNGYDLLERNHAGQTPLMVAAAFGARDAAATLIYNTPREVKVFDHTSTSQSVVEGHYEVKINQTTGQAENVWVAPKVVETKTDHFKQEKTIDFTDDAGKTAALYAAQTNQPETLTLLVNNGASIAKADNNGNSVRGFIQSGRLNIDPKSIGVHDLAAPIQVQISVSR